MGMRTYVYLHVCVFVVKLLQIPREHAKRARSYLLLSFFFFSFV